MKKISLIVGTCMALLVSVHEANAQVDEGQIDLNVGVGLITFGTAGDVGLPPISISGDYAIQDDITVGGFLGYYSSSVESFGYTYSYSYTIVAARGTYHYDLVDDFDTYGGVLLGYVVGGTSIEGPNVTPAVENAAQSVGGVAYGFFVGGRYHFTDNIGAFAEVGYGISLLNLGLTYKLD